MASGIAADAPVVLLLAGGANQFPGGSFTRWSPAPFTAHSYANWGVSCGSS
jgi:hypothetical protein